MTDLSELQTIISNLEKLPGVLGKASWHPGLGPLVAQVHIRREVADTYNGQHYGCGGSFTHYKGEWEVVIKPFIRKKDVSWTSLWTYGDIPADNQTVQDNLRVAFSELIVDYRKVFGTIKIDKEDILELKP